MGAGVRLPITENMGPLADIPEPPPGNLEAGMNERDLIRLAKRIAEALRARVDRNDWMRWWALAGEDVERGITVAQMIAKDPELRPRPRQAAQAIQKTLTRFRQDLLQLGPAERRALFGWVARLLLIQRWEAERQRRNRKKKGKSNG